MLPANLGNTAGSGSLDHTDAVGQEHEGLGGSIGIRPHLLDATNGGWSDSFASSSGLGSKSLWREGQAGEGEYTRQEDVCDQHLINSAHEKNRFHFSSSSGPMDERNRRGSAIFPMVSDFDNP